MITIEQLKDVKERTAALERYLDIENKLVQVEEEQLRTQAPGFWDDAKKAEAQMRKVKDLQKWIDGYREVKTMADELELAFDFCKDDLVTEEEVDAAYQKAVTAVEALELKNMLRQEADQMDCVLKINCGAGGTESQDWASMLMRMYMRWAETNGYKVSVANLQDGDEAGIKTVTMNIEGSFSYGYLKGENGVHRLVRVSPYNAQGKRMTSFASVFVTPLVDDSIEVTIEPARMSWDTFRSGGAGRLSIRTPARRWKRCFISPHGAYITSEDVVRRRSSTPRKRASSSRPCATPWRSTPTTRASSSPSPALRWSWVSPMLPAAAVPLKRRAASLSWRWIP